MAKGIFLYCVVAFYIIRKNRKSVCIILEKHEIDTNDSKAKFELE